MIQRVQTLILLAIVILGVILFALPVVQFASPEAAMEQHLYELSARGLNEVTEQISTPDEVPTLNGLWGLMMATLIIPFLALVDIFLYKNRIFQARWNIFLAAFCIGYYAVLGLFIWVGKNQLGCEWHLDFGACLPLICFILTLMATRRILKDEALVRAADRIR